MKFLKFYNRYHTIKGGFGQVTYELSNPSFAIDANDGTVTVVNPAFLDRESNPEITLQIIGKSMSS